VGAAETVVVGMREGGVVERVSDFISQLSFADSASTCVALAT
jgi:hypothetical protein